MRADIIPARLMNQARLRPTEPAYHVKSDGRWQAVEWEAYVAQVRRAAKAFVALRLASGDKVAMLGFNRPEWVIFHLAAMSIGAAGVGIYTTSSAEEVQYIVEHAGVRVLLVEDAWQWQKIAAARQNLPRLERVVMMAGAPAIDDSLVMPWSEFEAHGEGVTDSELDRRIDEIDPEALATLIYTSGTTGPPKGVMLSHASIAWTANVLASSIGMTNGDCSLSYLPLSHIAEQMLTIHGPASTGSVVYYAESLTRVADNIREVEPTILFGVPRIWEKFHAAVSARLESATGVKKILVDRARVIGRQVSELRQRGRSPGVLLAARYALANHLIFRRLKKALGLRDVRLCVSGAAPIAFEILDFFASLDILIHEVYGQSEGCGPTSFNMPGNTRLGSVGTSIPGVTVTIAQDGEILVKGPNVFLGYYKDEAATREALQGGWLHSGDLGRLDEDGFLYITGRKKEIIITAGGKNIAPGNIEASLKQHRLISEAVAIGDRRKYVSALITLDEDAARDFLARRGSNQSFDEFFGEVPELNVAVQEIVDEVNRHLAKVEQIKKFKILPRGFSMEGGELTPTLKVKRAVVSEKYAREIDAMYEEASQDGPGGPEPGEG